MDWWQRFKARHWNAQPPTEIERSIPLLSPGRYPPLRRAARRAARLWREQPLAVIATAAGVVAAIATVIRALR